MEAPPASTSFSPPTDGRRTGGMRTVAIRSGRLPGRGAERLVVREDAHLLVGDRIGLARADRALGIAADLDLLERRGERVVEQQAADERLALADDELDGLGGL